MHANRKAMRWLRKVRQLVFHRRTIVPERTILLLEIILLLVIYYVTLPLHSILVDGDKSEFCFGVLLPRLPGATKIYRFDAARRLF